MEDNILKVCSKCRTPLPLHRFAKDKQKLSGLRSSCKQCDKEYRLGKKKEYFKGEITNLRIFNKCLSKGEVDNLYKYGTTTPTLWQRIKGLFK